jgi:capsular polysaccharide biosynthesis protein
MTSRLGRCIRTSLRKQGFWRADLDEIGVRLGSERSSLHRDQLSFYARLLRKGAKPRTILDVTAEPGIALEVWRQAYPGATVRGVYSTESTGSQTPEAQDVVYPAHFDGTFWHEIARNLDPDVVVSDGSLGAEHQLEMFRIMFPVLRPGGLFILEDPRRVPSSPGDAAATTPSAAQEYFTGLADELAGARPAAAQGDDFRDYVLRNAAGVQRGHSSTVIRKRSYDQRKLFAVPFAQLAHEHQILDEPTPYQRIRPEILGSKPMSKRVDAMLARHAEAAAPSAEIGRIKNAMIIGEGIIVVAGKYVVEESFINQRHTARRDILFRVGQSDIYVTEQSLKRPRRLPPGPDYVCAMQTWDSNYGHWIVDTLPRVVNALELVDRRKARIVLNGRRTESMKSVYSQSLRLLGIEGSQFEWKEQSPLSFDELVYATPMSVPPLIKSERSLAILEKLALSVDDGRQQQSMPMERIYLSRNRYSRRRLLNEQDLLPLLRERGYVVVYPEELTLSQQISVFKNATHVVGNMGAALSNLCFSPQGVNVLALATEPMMHDYFYDLVCHKNGRYMSLQGTSPDQSEGIGADFTIDTEQFERAFNDFDGPGSTRHA